MFAHLESDMLVRACVLEPLCQWSSALVVALRAVIAAVVRDAGAVVVVVLGSTGAAAAAAAVVVVVHAGVVGRVVEAVLCAVEAKLAAPLANRSLVAQLARSVLAGGALG